MLSHLRFHRRGPSNPTSPVPDQGPWESSPLQSAQLMPEDGVPTPEIRPRSSTSVPHTGQAPPILPPITRVTSNEFDPSAEYETSDTRGWDDLKAPPEPASPPPPPPPPEPKNKPPPPPPRSPYDGDTGFIGGVALRNYRKAAQEALRSPLADQPEDNRADGDPSRSPIPTQNTASRAPPPIRPYRADSSFVTPTDRSAVASVGRRPAGTRLASEPHALPLVSSQDAPRGKRGTPFLKNPLSTLLMRRRTSQNVPDLVLPLKTGRSEPSYAPIRGTRIHDFSAPRQRRTIHNNELVGPASEKLLPELVSPSPEEKSPPAPPVPPKDDTSRSVRVSSVHSRTASVDNRSISSVPKPAAGSAIKTDGSESSQNEDGSAQVQVTRQPTRTSTGASTKKGRPRVVSQASILSSLPKHMKSTSSRFSFDMIGAAKQEKLLEERHRQRQLDKQEGEPEPEPSGPRDSRFDDFDEDAFDYDAMDYDDDLEERIPGVNADYDDDDYGDAGFGEADFGEVDHGEVDYGVADDDSNAALDPDNDQENFAGFVFQRSNPHSSLTSPQNVDSLPTPRDANGNIIGHAMSQYTPGLQQTMESPTTEFDDTNRPQSTEHEDLSGLGIHGLGMSSSPTFRQTFAEQDMSATTAQIPRSLPNQDDELYFGGLGDEFDGEGDGTAIDEALFDLDDTDQYGRPIPGMFAQALAQRSSRKEPEPESEAVNKRESDITSRLSAQSGDSQSTAHTSFSVDIRHKTLVAEANDEDQKSVQEQQPDISGFPATEQESMAAYQAALAAAAHQAAASGKFRRESDPPVPTDLTITSPTTTNSSQSHGHPEAVDMDDYELDDDVDNGLEDYELDDDAIIAEANASALASDSDGFYGQEFGFYSAPAGQYNHHANNVPADQSQFYGGFFGPSGVTRSKSGHLVSREPNLTPITERSEYSNRNSIMSLAMPNSANPASGSLQSPGLAQLAMMADDSDMSLSALLRLRSRAWGGSQASLSSSRDGSPSDRNGTSSPLGAESSFGARGGHARKNSAFSIWSQESGPGSGAGSPTLTMSMPSFPASVKSPPLPSTASPGPVSAPLPTFPPLQPTQPAAFPPVIEDKEADNNVPRRNSVNSATAADIAAAILNASTISHASNNTNQSGVSASNSLSNSGVLMKSSMSFKSPESSIEHPQMVVSASPSIASNSPVMERQRPPGKGHRHQGSADSISYVKEEQQDGGQARWVVERRRTAETGEIEILGRELVEGSRI